MSIIGCAVMIPINISLSHSNYSNSNGGKQSIISSAFTTMTPQYVSSMAIWSQVVCAWSFDAIVGFFLWWNYRAVVALRRRYFQSPEYHRTLHARTLMITHVPPEVRSDEGLLVITDKVNPTAAVPRTAIGHDVKGLPRLIRQHDAAVRRLESELAKYLKHPDHLPAKRPMMCPSRREGGSIRGKVDAIDYLTVRIKVLEEEINHARASIDKRSAMPYGFASWERIEHAHAVAHAARNKHPQGTNIKLAPRPGHIIWENLHLSPSVRRWRRFASVIWVIVLTLLWIAPNALIAVFLSNLNNLGRVWPTFQTSLSREPKLWAAVQGIASPALTSLVYLILPTVFRRLAVRAGNLTKTAREKDVLDRLYAFFVVNNLIVFSLFSAGWTFVSTVVNATHHNTSAWDAVRSANVAARILGSLCQVSPFWVVWLLQRSFGAAIDLSQLTNLVRVWFSKIFLAPTPRQAIEWTAPPPFDYAAYCNYFLFYATVALCFATLQPIVLPVTAFYFGLETVMKKYLLMYVFVTKNETAGRLWRLLFNRMVFATILANFVVALAVITKGTFNMLYCMIPLPFLMIGFKAYCMKAFDDDMEFYHRGKLTDEEALDAAGGGKLSTKSEGLSVKFGHPALYKPLITPMVHAKAGDALRRIYQGRLDPADYTGEYSDIMMEHMASDQPGKKSMHVGLGVSPSPFEFVPENHLDFAYFKDRPDFRDEFGGGIYGRPDDLITDRSHTPRSLSLSSAAEESRLRLTHNNNDDDESDDSDADVTDMHNHHASPPESQAGGLYYQSNESETRLLDHAERPARTPAVDRWRTGGYGPVQQDDG